MKRRSLLITKPAVNTSESERITEVETSFENTPCKYRKKRLRYITVPAIAWAILGLASSGDCEDQDMAKLFADRQVEGTIVISSLDGSQTFVHNETRAKTPYVPASTFKILNTLIALNEGALADDKVVLKWDGKDKGVVPWNRDQTLDTAFKSSCIWFYQELAQRIGMRTYEEHLKKAAYGNAKPGPELTTFWLHGDLKISAIEQVEFLRKIYRKEFPYQPSSYEILQRLMILEQTPAYTLRGKTGWAWEISPQVGWFVGYVEAKGGRWFFATNIDISSPEQTRLRQEITVEALKLKGIL